jgi:hypothetical protein
MGPAASSLLLLVSAYNSFAFDYLLRNSLSQPSIPQGTLEQIACPSPTSFQLGLAEVVLPRAIELTYTAWDLQPFAEDCGYHCPLFRWDEDRRFLIRCELDAAFFHLYGISREDVDHIMETFPIVKRKDEDEYDEYRTKRVILEIYDAMTDAIQVGHPYETCLDPPPSDPRVAHSPKSSPAVDAPAQ